MVPSKLLSLKIYLLSGKPTGKKLHRTYSTKFRFTRKLCTHTLHDASCVTSHHSKLMFGRYFSTVQLKYRAPSLLCFLKQLMGRGCAWSNVSLDNYACKWLYACEDAIIGIETAGCFKQTLFEKFTLPA